MYTIYVVLYIYTIYDTRMYCNQAVCANSYSKLTGVRRILLEQDGTIVRVDLYISVEKDKSN